METEEKNINVEKNQEPEPQKEEKTNKKAEKKKHNELEELNKKLLEELNEEKAKSMRISAEMINFKKRKEDELANYLKYANEGLVTELLPIVDNFERAIRMDNTDLSDEVSKFLEGFKMIYSNLINILNKCEVKEIEAEGIEFNPNYHQAVLTEKDENKPSGVVLEVLQKGYMYKDKVIRPAMVNVNE